MLGHPNSKVGKAPQLTSCGCGQLRSAYLITEPDRLSCACGWLWIWLLLQLVVPSQSNKSRTGSPVAVAVTVTVAVAVAGGAQK